MTDQAREKIRVVVVDDQPLERAGNALILDSDAEIEVVGEAGNGIEAIGLVTETRPSIVLMDVRMPLMDGIECQWPRTESGIGADPAHEEVYIAWRCAQDLRAAYKQTNPKKALAAASRVVEIFHTCPIPEVARLGRTLRKWKDAFLAYFTTARTSNGGAEAVNGIIELHRRLARGYRNLENYRLRMLLAAGDLSP